MRNDGLMDAMAQVTTAACPTVTKTEPKVSGRRRATAMMSPRLEASRFEVAS